MVRDVDGIRAQQEERDQSRRLAQAWRCRAAVAECLGGRAAAVATGLVALMRSYAREATSAARPRVDWTSKDNRKPYYKALFLVWFENNDDVTAYGLRAALEPVLATDLRL